MTETEWDAGATLWDTALGLPDGRTIWDRDIEELAPVIHLMRVPSQTRAARAVVRHLSRVKGPGEGR